MFIRFFCIIMLFLQITACDIGFKENKKDDEALKESDKIINEYKKVQGEYRGTLNLTIEGSQTSQVGIKVILTPKVTYGGRSDGELVPQVSLVGSLEVLDFVWSYNFVNYIGRYWYALDGRIHMVEEKSAGQQGSSNGNGLEFEVYQNGIHLVNGILKNSRGELGRFEAQLVHSDVKAPGEGESEERRKRLKETYQQMLGSYVGQIHNPNDPEKHRRDLPLRFRFFLTGSEIRASVDNPRTDAERIRPLTVETYRPDTGLIILTGTAIGGGTMPSYGIFYALGYLKENELYLEEISDHLGSLGTFYGEKLVD